MKTKVVFLGSKPIGYQCLDYLIRQQEDLQLEIVGVRTQLRKEFSSAQDLEALAKDAGIPLLSSLDQLPECDLIYSVQHHELLKAHHISKASKIAVNLHLAPLPEYRGCNQFSFALLDQAAEFGATIHTIDTRIDHGDILYETRFPIPPDCWVKDLYEITETRAFALFCATLPNLVQGHYTRTPQKAFTSRTSSLHFRHEIQRLKCIDLNDSQEKIERIIRAVSMPGFEPPYCIINGQKIYFSKAYKFEPS
jgi:methionyl-tRNA formyltransferase